MKLNTSFLTAALVRLADATLAKLTQKSTIAGLLTFGATALGATIEPGLAGTITAVGATVASGLLVIFDEKVKPAETAATLPVDHVVASTQETFNAAVQAPETVEAVPAEHEEAPAEAPKTDIAH